MILKHRVIVDMHKSHDVEGCNGIEVEKGLAKTLLIGYAETTETYEKLKTSNA